ncbi:MATE family efflux transporter [Romboutsia weinsteinii]|uniref:MATE family efflux transporter n=1 Tax=Romboutsia weinsteinii TaxID=2020949 RepID=UPI001FB167D9|nr:MATE family efflux transporter [Romboutsia weinsteinii]
MQDFGNAFSTFVAQNKGVNKIDRIQEGGKDSVKIIIIFCIIISTIILIFSRYIMHLFISKNETKVISLGVEYLSVVSIFYLWIGFLFMFYGLFRGLGLLKICIVLTVISLGTIVVLAYILASTSLGERGIWWSIPIGWF